MKDRMRIVFWGVRGSLPAPGRATSVFGGNTSCIAIEAGGEHLICEAGSGIRDLGRLLLRRAADGPVEATVLISHFHWDHYIGLPFFQPLYRGSSRLTIAGPGEGKRSFRSRLEQAIAPPGFPVPLASAPATIAYRTVSRRAFSAGRFRVTPVAAHHPGATFGWRIVGPDARSVVVMTDDEPGDARHEVQLVKALRGASALIHDAQYPPEIYETRKGWGHSPCTYPAKLAAAAGIPVVYLTHYDPAANDLAVRKLGETAKAHARKNNLNVTIRLAREGHSFTL
jgi:phosphoribosyl 1,2-cyclic phosphodiesterase